MKRLHTARTIGALTMALSACMIYGCGATSRTPAAQQQITLDSIRLASDTGCFLLRNRKPELGAQVLVVLDTRVRPLLEVSHDPVGALQVVGGMVSAEVPEAAPYVRPALGLLQLYLLDSQGVTIPAIDPRYSAGVSAVVDGCRAALITP